MAESLPAHVLYQSGVASWNFMAASLSLLSHIFPPCTTFNTKNYEVIK